MAKNKRRSSKRAELKTSAGNTFTKERTKSGRTIYRKNGKFSSERAFKSARRHAVIRREEETFRVDLGKRYRTQGDIAYTDKKGRWRAGEDAADYIPGLRKGQLLDPDSLSELRRIRGRERNFISFATLPMNEDLTEEEILAAYYDFLDAISKAKTAKARTRVLRAFGWSY